MFPRCGAYVGFHPIKDPRVMRFNITGPGGARELLWIERQEGYGDRIIWIKVTHCWFIRIVRIKLRL